MSRCLTLLSKEIGSKNEPFNTNFHVTNELHKYDDKVRWIIRLVQSRVSGKEPHDVQ